MTGDVFSQKMSYTVGGSEELSSVASACFHCSQYCFSQGSPGFDGWESPDRDSFFFFFLGVVKKDLFFSKKMHRRAGGSNAFCNVCGQEQGTLKVCGVGMITQ